MLNRLTADLQFHAKALGLRAERQAMIASNIANADTPNYKARDLDFSAQLAKATGTPVAATTGAPPPMQPMVLPQAGGASAIAGQSQLTTSDARHLATGGGQVYSTLDGNAQYRVPDQAAMDGNTVELDRERAAFADNTVRYEATLRFINGNVRSILSAIRGE
jgi:flagellar basal-body rod protein FlgB